MGFGLYQALRGTDNWAQKRQDKMQSLMIAKEREQGAQKELKQSMELEQGMQKYFDEMKNLDALAEDQGRINDEEKKARRKIYKGVAAANGNLKAYMSSGGISAMSDYRNSIMNSEAAKNAATNKANLANYAKDRSENKFVKNVTFEVPVMKDGQPTGETKTITRTMDEQYALFQKGVIKKMNYSGAEDKVKIDMFKFADQAKNPNSPYYSANVTTGDYMTYIKSQGGSEEQALTRAKGYADDVAGGMQAWKWGKEDYYADQLAISKIEKNRRSGGSKDGSSKTVTTNALPTALQRAATSTAEYGAEVEFGPEDDGLWSDLYGLKVDGETGMKTPSGIFNIVDINDNSIIFDASNAIDIEFTGKYVGKKGRKYALVKTTYLADNPKAKNPHQESSVSELNSIVHEKTNKGNWTFSEMDDGTDIVSGLSYLDVTDKIDDSYSAAGINKEIGQKSTQENRPASITQKDMRLKAEMEGQAIADIRASGMSYQDAVATYNRKLDSQQQ